MPLRVTNTRTGQRELFEPADPAEVTLYYCGLTVSDDAHLGHARSWVHVDVMRRWLEHLGYGVSHIENVTDVNEKIVARIGDAGDSEREVASNYLRSVIDSMRALNLRRADLYPRVTEHVSEIIELVETLIEAGHAYEADGSVYFDVESFEEYGALSNQPREELESHQERRQAKQKRHPEDFALWKAGGVSAEAVAGHRDGAPSAAAATMPVGETWNSPWGEGRPGWHIECSAMSMTHLGSTIDIHVGGQDLVFPHHENEVAQSEAATGDQFVRYWLHTALLETDGEKMSSSLGNFFRVEEAIESLGANVLRAFFLSSTYNAAQTYSEATIAEATERWDRLARAYDRAREALDSPAARAQVTDEELRETVETVRERFHEAMNDDFNTREAMAALLDLATATNRYLDANDQFDYRGLHRALLTDEAYGEEVLGFSFDAPGAADGPRDALIEIVLEAREQARADGDFERADRLRAQLTDLGIEIQDTEEGTSYRV
jgi:cysteinyl-tRNA synthetase